MSISPDDFKKYSRYTVTHVAVTNFQLNHIDFWRHVPFPKFEKDPLNGVKRADVKLPSKYNGIILQVKYKDAFKGIHIRGYGQRDENSGGCFSNSTSVLMYMDKLIVLKIPSEGKIQITGCKDEEQVYKALHFVWRYICKIKEKHPEISNIAFNEYPKIIYTTAMNNINMNLGFKINKRKVHEYLYKHTDFNIIPNDEQYAGVTAKLEVGDPDHMKLVRHRFIDGKWYASKADWVEYLAMLTAKDRKKIMTEPKYHTFLIFHSGKVIQTGPFYELMEDAFRYFINTMNDCRAEVEDFTEEVAVKKKK